MIQTDTITYVIFLIFTGTAILATVALLTHQSLLIAYIILGAIMGPWGLKLINDSTIIQQTGDIGIIFLLFLLGLDLQPQNLFHSLRKMSIIALCSSLIFFATGLTVCWFLGYSANECSLLGIIAMFSSTIIGIKLLPTTILHHQHTGGLVVSILLIQDIIAIAVLFGLNLITNHTSMLHLIAMIGAFPVLMAIAYLSQKYILSWLIARFDQVHEYIFILSIGWCLCLTELSYAMGLSQNIGAFIAGISLASHPIANYITESLKPLRDFFLILFFFAIGAAFNFSYFSHIIIAASIFAGVMLISKPIIFHWLLRYVGEIKPVCWEIGVRLGQMSEFSLLVIYLAFDTHLLQPETAYMAEAAIILTFVVSCYWTVLKYPTPLATRKRLRRD